MKKNKYKQAKNGKSNERWETMSFSDAISVNPIRPMKKGLKAKYVGMADLKEFNKKIQSYVIREYRGGSKYRNDDTLMARITPCLENGKTAYVDILNKGEIGGGSTEFIILTGKEGKTIPQFAYYLAISPDIRNKSIQSMIGTSGRQRVEPDIFNKIIIDLPPLPEQRAIAKILSDLDEKIEKNNQMNKTLEAIGQALFNRWFVDFRFPGYEKAKFVKGLPEGWEKKPIGDYVKIVGGSTPSTIKASFWEGGKINWATPKDLAGLDCEALLDTERYITEDGLDEIGSGLLPVGTVLLSSRAPIGYLAVAEIPVAINQGFIAIICNRKAPNIFIKEWVKQNLDAIKGRANGTTFMEISKSNFRSIFMIMPTQIIMDSFMLAVFDNYLQIVENAKQNKLLKNIRDSLLPKLISGEIRVNGGN
jgi:type I restriction enzyme S subunit